MKLSLKLQMADTILADSICLVGATADFLIIPNSGIVLW